MRGMPAAIGGMPLRSKRASERQSLRQFALALEHVDGDVGLAIDLGCVVLRGRGGDGRVAQNDFVGHAAGDFDSERQRRHVEQEHVFGDGGTAAENMRLDCRAESYDFVGI